jgi:hypothetical protein
MNRVRRSLAPALMIVCVAGCGSGKRPYDTPRPRVDGDQAVALFQREVQRRGLHGTFSKAQRVATQTPSGRHAWLVHLSSPDASDELCGYVWRGEEAGRADGTIIRIRFDRDCRHWTD